jgi:hypothetical protein
MPISVTSRTRRHGEWKERLTVADVPATAVSNFLAVLRTLPVWLLAGLALAGYGVIFIPGFGGIDPNGFRAEWGVWVWIEAIGFSVLTVTRAIDSSITAYLEHQKKKATTARAAAGSPSPTMLVAFSQAERR